MFYSSRIVVSELQLKHLNFSVTQIFFFFGPSRSSLLMMNIHPRECYPLSKERSSSLQPSICITDFMEEFWLHLGYTFTLQTKHWDWRMGHPFGQLWSHSYPMSSLHPSKVENTLIDSPTGNMWDWRGGTPGGKKVPKRVTQMSSTLHLLVNQHIGTYAFIYTFSFSIIKFQRSHHLV